MSKRCFRFMLISLIFACHSSLAQKTNEALASKSIHSNDSTYFAGIGDGSFLYTGEEYLPHRLGIKGIPFFLSDQMQPSEIHYNGIRYTNIPILYDLVRQKIVLNRFHDNPRMSLLNEKVKYFRIGGHLFVNNSISMSSDSLPPTFLEVLHTGRLEILAARIKEVELTLNTEIPPTFAERDAFYISNGKTYFRVSDRKSLLNSFGDHRQKIKDFVRKNGFRFKESLEADLLKTAKFYDALPL